MTMFNEGTDTAMIASLRAELEMARRIAATYEAANARLIAGGAEDLERISKLEHAVWAAGGAGNANERVRVLVAMISDHADDICGVQPLQSPDASLAAVGKFVFELRQRVAVLEKSLATMPPGWSADLDAMERSAPPTDAVEPPITIAHDGMGPCEACDRDVVAGQEVRVYGDGPTPEESDDDIVVHALCPEVKHAYRCPVHGVIEVMVSRADVPDEVPCSLDSWSVAGGDKEYATRVDAEEAALAAGIHPEQASYETQRCADTCPRDVAKLPDDALIAEIAKAPPREPSVAP